MNLQDIPDLRYIFDNTSWSAAFDHLRRSAGFRTGGLENWWFCSRIGSVLEMKRAGHPLLAARSESRGARDNRHYWNPDSQFDPYCPHIAYPNPPELSSEEIARQDEFMTKVQGCHLQDSTLNFIIVIMNHSLIHDFHSLFPLQSLVWALFLL